MISSPLLPFLALNAWQALLALAPGSKGQTVSLEFETYDSREQTMTNVEICNHLIFYIVLPHFTALKEL